MVIWLSGPHWSFDRISFITRETEDWRCGTAGWRIDAAAVRLHCY